MGNWKTHALIENSGATVVIDETCTGQRYYNNLVEDHPDDLVGQLSAIADRYFRINCSCFTPNSDRLDAVVKTAQDYRVHGTVQYILQYCHTYNIEAIRIEGALKKANVPSLKIETDYSEEDTGQLRTRVEAFLEKLS
jgi:benzoyl-CoA reductase/2-hydroxyglutaryl-CoA dehydratase subunit BcrC/BadD/HgdB